MNTIFKKYKFILAFVLLCNIANAQNKSFKLNHRGDTINIVKNDGKKTGKWVIEMPELRGESGFVEEGKYVNDEKNGVWRKYTIEGDLLAIENYKHGGKDGVQQYFTFMGSLIREEAWMGYNPDSPYVDIPVYGPGNGEIIAIKRVKSVPYSVKQGVWKYFDSQSGALLKTEIWELNNLQKPELSQKKSSDKEESANVASSKKKEVTKTAQMIEWEKKNRGKKKALRDGKTGL